MKLVAAAGVSVLCVWSGGASGAAATFDSLVEGDLGPTFVDGGITFFGLDDRAGTADAPFSCERADGTLGGPGFSAPNAMGFGSWVPGPFAAFSQCGSFSFTTGAVETFASVDVFEWMSPAGNTIWLEAYRNGVLVASDSAVIPGNLQINHWTLSVSGSAFDTLRVNGTGPTDRGIFIGLVDNVVVVPGPATAGVAAAAVLLGLRRRRSP
ncbi:MAG: hypothetical protein GIKADHBN_02429 [Phycisphaerales bacterium]|nr:hypothetical protein [Phycisphaerales bacterium]